MTRRPRRRRRRRACVHLPCARLSISESAAGTVAANGEAERWCGDCRRPEASSPCRLLVAFTNNGAEKKDARTARRASTGDWAEPPRSRTRGIRPTAEGTRVGGRGPEPANRPRCAMHDACWLENVQKRRVGDRINGQKKLKGLRVTPQAEPPAHTSARPEKARRAGKTAAPALASGGGRAANPLRVEARNKFRSLRGEERRRR